MIRPCPISCVAMLTTTTRETMPMLDILKAIVVPLVALAAAVLVLRPVLRRLRRMAASSTRYDAPHRVTVGGIDVPADEAHEYALDGCDDPDDRGAWGANGCTCHLWPECIGASCAEGERVWGHNPWHDPLNPPDGDCAPDWSGVPACPVHVGSLARLLTEDESVADLDWPTMLAAAETDAERAEWERDR